MYDWLALEPYLFKFINFSFTKIYQYFKGTNSRADSIKGNITFDLEWNIY